MVCDMNDLWLKVMLMKGCLGGNLSSEQSSWSCNRKKLQSDDKYMFKSRLPFEARARERKSRFQKSLP